MPVRLVIADDHAMLRRGLQLILSQQPDFQVVGESGNVRDTADCCGQLQPDVVLLDISMPGGDGLALLQKLRTIAPGARIVVLSMHEDSTTVRAAMAAGAAGYVVKSAQDETLVAAIRAVVAGRTFVDAPLRDAATPWAEDSNNPAGIPRPVVDLSPREREVLDGLARGHTNQEVADRLALSVKTIETYRARLMQKLGLHSRAELTRYAATLGNEPS